MRIVGRRAELAGGVERSCNDLRARTRMVLLELAEPVAEADPGAEGPVTETEEPISQDAGEEGGLEPAQPLPQSKDASLLPQARIAVPQRLVPPMGAPRSPGRTDGLRTGWQIGAGGKLYIPRRGLCYDSTQPSTRKAAFSRTLPRREVVHAENEVGEDHALLVRLLGTHQKAVESSPVKRLDARRLVSPPKAQSAQSCSPSPGMTVCTVEGARDLSFTSSMGRLGKAGGPRMAPTRRSAALWPGATAPPPADSTGVAERAEPSRLDGRSDEADVPADAPLRRAKTVQIELPPSTPPRSASQPQLASPEPAALAKTAPSALPGRASVGSTSPVREGHGRRDSSLASLRSARSG